MLQSAFELVVEGRRKGKNSPLLSLNAVGGQTQDVQSSIANQAKVCTRSDSDSRVKEGRVLYGIAVEARRLEFQHPIHDFRLTSES